ncbi:unnamed protein product [Urochloa humidicola]
MSRKAQSRKEAGAAARDLLKADTARLRKAFAPLKRNCVAPSMQKDPTAPVRKDVAAATPPRSFTDGSSSFFNGNGGEFFSSSGPSSQPWNH